MTIRTNTINKYFRVLSNLPELLEETDGYLDAYEYAFANVISAGTIGDLVKGGFLRKVGAGRYRHTGKEITEDAIRTILEQRNIDRGRSRKPDSRITAANDNTICGVGTQAPLGLVQPEEAPEKPQTTFRQEYSRSVSLEDFRTLERRVASLEQLLIRRGVA